MTGAVATIALTPQMLVPTAMSVPSRLGNPSARLMKVTAISAVAMQQTMIGIPINPVFATACTPRPRPSMTIPSRRMVFRHRRNPGSYAFGTPTVFRTSRPSTTASMIGLTGDFS
jgi:hypothetical protein